MAVRMPWPLCESANSKLLHQKSDWSEQPQCGALRKENACENATSRNRKITEGAVKCFEEADTAELYDYEHVWRVYRWVE